jgi:hypothetical protein
MSYVKAFTLVPTTADIVTATVLPDPPNMVAGWQVSDVADRYEYA